MQMVKALVRWWKKFTHTHRYSESVLLEKILQPEIHEDVDFVYAANKYKCSCGEIWWSRGLELKKPVKEWLREVG